MISSQWYGKTDYLQSMKLMTLRAEQSLQTGDAYVLGFEYDTTITMGMRATREAGNTPTPIGDIPIIPVSRGGLVTLHNPGQVVIYPVVPIKRWGIFAKKWVSIITDTTEKTLSFCNIIVSDKNAGLFTPVGKIASIGIDLKRGVSTHGIAVNVSNDLGDFSKITPCGISHAVFDRVSNYIEISVENFFSLWATEFSRSVASYDEQSLTKSLSAP